MTTLIAAVAAILIQIVIATIAYQQGRRRSVVTLPSALIQELREHKVHCIGEPPQSVALEIRLLCSETPRT